MVEILNNMLTNDEFIFLNSSCSPFIPTDNDSVIGGNNYYIRKKLDIKIDLLDYQKKCITHLGDEYEIEALWVNKVTPNTNKNNKFHYDTSDITIITYINEDFKGGDFEYFFEKEKIKIKPITNCSIIIDDKIPHRVLNVTNGERFSLISFYKKIEKKIKILI